MPETLEQWKAAIIRLIEDAGLRQEIAQAARKDVEERFSVKKQAGELVAVFNEVLARKGISR